MPRAYRDGTLSVIPPGHSPLTLTVWFMVKGRDASPFEYIQKARSGELSGWGDDPEKSNTAMEFYGSVSFHAGPLGWLLAESKFDAFLRAPSRFRQAAYLCGMAAKGGTKDISDRFNKTGVARSGEGALPASLRSDLQYSHAGDEGGFQRVLIVDDSLASGNSAAAIIGALLDSGVPTTCEFTLACYFWADATAASDATNVPSPESDE